MSIPVSIWNPSDKVQGSGVVKALFRGRCKGRDRTAQAEAMKAVNEARRDQGRGSHPEAEARQMETERQTETREQKVGPTRRNQT